jgi:hypothetical protein
MLIKLKQLRESLNDEQDELLRSVLPEDIVQRFFSSENEEDAVKVVEDLNKNLAARPLVAFDLYKNLLPEQRAMIADLAFDDDDDED